jgi:uncharacterized membrane protein
MPSLPQNRWAGIRTPSTLRSDANWKVSHQIAGKSMAAGGVLCILASLLLTGVTLFVVCFSAVMLSAFVPVVASYMIHRAQR